MTERLFDKEPVAIGPSDNSIKDESLEYDLSSKTIIVGDMAVGKTCLMNAISGKEYTQSLYNSSTLLNRIIIPMCDKRVLLQIWDACSNNQEQDYYYRIFSRSEIRGFDTVILCYDVTNQESYNNAIGPWLEVLRRADNVTVILVGTKCDLYLHDVRAVDFDTAKKFAADEKIDFIETSSKNTINIETLSQLIAQRRLDNIDINRSPKPIESTQPSHCALC